MRRLADTPCLVYHVGELGQDIATMSVRNASENARGQLTAMLDLYDTADYRGLEYSDGKRNISAVSTPSMTLVGNTTLGVLSSVAYGALESGLLQRAAANIAPCPVVATGRSRRSRWS